MKLITLNIWGGNITKPLLEFISNHKGTDIFCFQEVLNGKNIKPDRIIIKNAKNIVGNIYSKIEDILPNHKGYFAATQNEAGLAIFINKNINVSNTGDLFVHRWKDSREKGKPETLGRNLQFIRFIKNKNYFTVCNFHGLWTGKGKEDTPQRIKQSEKVEKFLDNQTGAKILVGDFNLNPGTQSLAILDKDMIDLVKEYKVISTRSKLYSRYELGDRFADYILVSKAIKVLSFKVLQDEVSDHLPLYLEFE
jgi:endonuclease/exonuclease/phosphatase family metal-dependent hydrolase